MTLGLREIVMALVAVLLVYLLYLGVRFARLGRAQLAPRREPMPEYQTVLDLYGVPSEAPEPSAAQAVPEPPPAGAPAHEAFDAMVGLARLRFQVEALEARQGSVQAELDALRGELAALRNARNVAPQYGEAVTLAQRGLASDAIAERCGISVSEAELVAALARGIRSQE